MTPKQRLIVGFANQNDGKISKQQAVELIGSSYYCNADKHVGDILSRMVNAGLIIRLKPGTFELSKTQNKKLKNEPENPAQQNLFG